MQSQVILSSLLSRITSHELIETLLGEQQVKVHTYCRQNALKESNAKVLMQHHLFLLKVLFRVKIKSRLSSCYRKLLSSTYKNE